MAQFFHDFGHPTTQGLCGGCPEHVPTADFHRDLVENSRPAPTSHSSQSQPAFPSAVRGLDAGADLVVLLERVGGLLPPAIGKAALLGGVVKDIPITNAAYGTFVKVRAVSAPRLTRRRPTCLTRVSSTP